jgi:hypothetical protein
MTLPPVLPLHFTHESANLHISVGLFEGLRHD